MTEYVPFRPVHARGDELVASPGLGSDEFRERLRRVLTFYGVPWRLGDDGAVLVPRPVWDDRDTSWNYTSKAEDDEWLAAHV
jgi:hypothetical protein